MVTDTDAGTTNAPAETTGQDGNPRGRQAASRFTIAGNVIAQTCTRLEERGRNAFKWLEGYCHSKNLSHKEVASKLKQPTGEGYSADSLYQALTGRREPDQLGNLVEAIERFRRVEEERAGQVKTGFIETTISRRVFEVCRRAFLRNRVAFIFGETQIGKTAALEEYSRQHNHGETKLFRFPAGGAYCDVLREMALMLNLRTGNNGVDLRRQIIECFDEHMLLVADEIMESTSTHYAAGSRRCLRTINFLREIHDRKRCGLVLCGTNIFRDALKHGGDARNLRQLVMRGLPPLQLPDRLLKDDLDAFAEAFGLGPAPDEIISVKVTCFDSRGRETSKPVSKNALLLETEINEQFGVGRWKTILEEASDLARAKRKPMTWSAVIAAWHTFENSSDFEVEAKSKGGA